MKGSLYGEKPGRVRQRQRDWLLQSQGFYKDREKKIALVIDLKNKRKYFEEIS